MVDPDTSGWRVVTNCTKSLGSGGRNGDGVLTLTSAAAGEMQASTFMLYSVTGGVTYQAFVDASSANQPERIGIEWFSGSLASIGATWSLTTSAASSTWHRVSVAAVAPVGAVRARILLSATTSASGKTHFFENAYLGQPFRTSGNLLSFNVESGGEIDTSGWAVDANCTISRDVPAVSWPVDWYYSGGEVIKATVTANGNASIKTAEAPAVVPGTEYRGYCYLNPSTSSSSCWVELRWFNASNTLISSKRGTLAAPGTGWYRQYVSGVAPAGAATCVLAAGITSATAGQVVRVEGAVAQVAPQLVPGSVLSYEDTSFEQGVGGWTISSGSATIARSTPWGTAAYGGSYALTLTAPASGTSVLASARYPVTPSVSWRAQGQFAPASGIWQIGPNIHWYDGSGTSISRSALVADSVPATGTWWATWNDVTAPANAATAAIEIDITAPAAGTLEIDWPALFEALPSWDVEADDDLGLITVTMRDLDSGDTLTLYRVVGGAQSIVRGPDGWLQGTLLSSTQMVVEDYEAPIGQDVTYRRELYVPSTGALQQSATSSSVSLAMADPSEVWLKDAQQPWRNVRLTAAVAPDWARPIEATEYRVRGRRNSVILTDVRGGLTGTLQVWTLSDAERAALHFLLDTGHPLLIQLNPGLGIEDVYASVGEATEARFIAYGGEPRRQWSLPLTQVDAPLGGVGGSAAWTVQDVATTWATVLDASAAYATVLDMVLDNRQV
jgi:hypothetical protein